MILERKYKAPDSTVDFPVNWSNWFDTSGDTISSVTWTIVESDQTAGVYSGPPKKSLGTKTLSVSSSSFTSVIATVWLTGGIMNRLYQVTCHMTSTQGRIEDATFEVLITRK